MPTNTRPVTLVTVNARPDGARKPTITVERADAAVLHDRAGDRDLLTKTDGIVAVIEHEIFNPLTSINVTRTDATCFQEPFVARMSAGVIAWYAREGHLDDDEANELAEACLRAIIRRWRNDIADMLEERDRLEDRINDTSDSIREIEESLRGDL